MGYSVILEEGITAKTETIRARVEAKLKAEAEAVLDELGLTASDAIRLFYKQVALRRAFLSMLSFPTLRPARRCGT